MIGKMTCLFGGLVSTISSQVKNLSSIQHQRTPSSNASFLISKTNGDRFLHPSVCVPSALPLLMAEAIHYSAHKQSMLKGEMFVARQVLRARTSKSICYDRLDPLQGILINSISNAMQSVKHDVMDWTCTRGWLNLPVGLSMEHEIYKAANTLRSYCQIARLNPEVYSSSDTILTVAKAGALLTYKFGTGLVISKRSVGSWSAPSAILSMGLGWGAQIGGKIMDFIVVLHGSKAVKAFTCRMHCSLKAGLSLAAGPVGRVVEADIRAGDTGSGMCYTYSCSKGAFDGVSLEGNIVATRMDTNLRFCGDPYMSTAFILLGNMESPKAATPLYPSPNYLFSSQR